jgi:hypothetical protein
MHGVDRSLARSCAAGAIQVSIKRSNKVCSAVLAKAVRRHQPLGLRRRCERRREPDQVARHHATRTRPRESFQRHRVRPYQAAPHQPHDSSRAASDLYRRPLVSQRRVVCLHGVLERFRWDQFPRRLEYRLSRVELRGAGRYSQGHWYPAAGAGYNFTRTFGIDAALYGTHTFLEPDPHVGLAISLRFERR